MRKVIGITVCVGYCELFLKSLKIWKESLDSLWVITSPEDKQTIAHCKKNGINVSVTSVFTESGAMFNKGAAIAGVYDKVICDQDDWVLFFDADIEPPQNWRKLVARQEPDETCVYGAPRYQGVISDESLIADTGVAGWFMLFHSKSDAAAARPIVPVNYIHAGNYDTDFVERWPAYFRKMLDLKLIHHGEPWVNWCGIGNEQGMQSILDSRAAGRPWQSEVIDTKESGANDAQT
jgi:hypothetical protein